MLAPLAALAERQHLVVAGIAHMNKDHTARLLSRVGGSVAFGGAPRAVLAFARHPDDPDGEQGNDRVIVHAKSNYGRYAPSLAARIESREVPDVGEVGLLVIGEECEVGPEDLGTRDGQHSDLEAATEWLADGEWHESREIKARAKADGHSERTLKRAKARLPGRGSPRGVPGRLGVAPASWASP